MKEKTMGVLNGQHGKANNCMLTWNDGLGALYMQGTASLWINLWANAENQMNIQKLSTVRIADDRIFNIYTVIPPTLGGFRGELSFPRDHQVEQRPEPYLLSVVPAISIQMVAD